MDDRLIILGVLNKNNGTTFTQLRLLTAQPANDCIHDSVNVRSLLPMSTTIYTLLQVISKLTKHK